MTDELMMIYANTVVENYYQFKKYMSESELKIRAATQKNQPHSHNVISLILQDVYKTMGVQAANFLVKKTKVDKIFGIKEIEVTQ